MGKPRPRRSYSKLCTLDNLLKTNTTNRELKEYCHSLEMSRLNCTDYPRDGTAQRTMDELQKVCPDVSRETMETYLFARELKSSRSVVP